MGVSIQPHLLKICFTLSVIDAYCIACYLEIRHCCRLYWTHLQWFDCSNIRLCCPHTINNIQVDGSMDGWTTYQRRELNSSDLEVNKEMDGLKMLLWCLCLFVFRYDLLFLFSLYYMLSTWKPLLSLICLEHLSRF